MSDMGPRADWDARYGAAPVWSGRVNDSLRVWGETHGPQKGDCALDLACGEGGDALWLAQEGWNVTGVDFVATAITRAANFAAERGLAVAWITADLATWTPPHLYRLVSLSFFHEPHDVRHKAWNVAASAVTEGGTLLITGHAPDEDPDAPGPAAHTRFGLPEVLEYLGEGWTPNYREVRREATGHHAGRTMTDLVVELTRLDAFDSSLHR